MTNLAKITDINLCPTLNKEETQIVKANISKRVSEIKDIEIATELKNSLGQAMIAMGSKSLNENDVLMLVKQLTEYIKIKFQYARIGDIVMAIKLGSFGEFKADGDVLYLSAANVIQWFKKYQSNKMDVMVKQSKFEQEQYDIELSKQIEMESRERYYNSLAKNISNANYGTCKMAWKYFEELWSFGLLELEKEEIDAIKRNAKEKVISELKSQRKSIVKIGDVQINNMANKKSKEIAFYTWLEENQGNDIEEMINKKLKEKNIIE